MPSTDSVHSLRLEYRRATVAAFWLLGSTILFLLFGAAGTAIGAQAPWRVAASIVAAMLLPGVLWRPWFERGVWVWNGCVHRLAAALSTYILRVTYVFLLAPLGVCSSSLDLSSSQLDRSRWIKRPQGTDDRVSGRQSVSNGEGLQHGLPAFMRTPGNGWAAALIPLVFLLGLLRDTRQEATVPGSTYTLY